MLFVMRCVEYGGELQVKEKQSVPAAIERFLDLIIDCKEPAVFFTFIRALKDNGSDQSCFCFNGSQNKYNYGSSAINLQVVMLYNLFRIC
jgi:hypothetical protein